MPKENTHLFFSKQLLSDHAPLADEAGNFVPAFLWGSVSPDTFYYGLDSEIIKASDLLHQSHDTAEILISLLSHARRTGKPEDRGFALGFATHCALDLAFHPYIEFLTEQADRDGLGREYHHRLIETAMDMKICSGVFLWPDMSLATGLGIDAFAELAKLCNLNERQCAKAVRVQYWANRIFASNAGYFVLNCMGGLFLANVGDILALCYGHARRRADKLPEMPGRELSGLMIKARSLAEDMLNRASRYLSGAGPGPIRDLIGGRRLGDGQARATGQVKQG